MAHKDSKSTFAWAMVHGPCEILDCGRGRSALIQSSGAPHKTRSFPMFRRVNWPAVVLFIMIMALPGLAQKAGPLQWQNDLTPIAVPDWNYDFAAHLLERAGFGGTPEEIQELVKLSPAEAVRRLVYFQSI